MWHVPPVAKYMKWVTPVVMMMSMGASVASAQNSRPDSNVVVELTSVRFGVWRYADKSQFIRLTRDETVTWDESKPVATYERHIAKITLEEVGEIAKRISIIGREGLLKEMGPYNTYKDTEDELKIYAHTPTGALRFGIWNP